MNPNTLGVILLVLLVAFAETRSYARTRKVQRRKFNTAASKAAQ